MEQPETEQQWEKEGDEDVEDEDADLRGRKPRNHTPTSTPSSVSSGFSDDNGGDVVNNDHVNQEPEEMLKIKSNGVKIDSLLVANSDLQPEGALDLSHVEEGAEKQEQLEISTDGVKFDDLDLQMNIEAVDDPKESEYSVYFDKDKGIWKCRVCSWEIQSGSCLIDHFRSFKRHWHSMMSSKILNQQPPCFIHETEGVGFGYKLPVADHTRVECYAQKIPADDNLDVRIHSLDVGNGLINNQHEQNAKHEIVSASSLQFSEISFEELNQTSFKSFGNKPIEGDDIYLINDGEEETELDIETVLKKQETHDLFCPNCNSCITRRVILRKRKHRVRIAEGDAKRNRLGSLIHSDLDLISAAATNNRPQTEVNLNDNLPSGSNDYDHEGEPGVFRCLSCLSIFIPTKGGMKLFRMFGDRSKKESTQDSEKISAAKSFWFPSIFASKKAVLLTEAATSQKSDVDNSTVGALSNPDEPKGETTSRQEVDPHGSHEVDSLDKHIGTVDPYSKLDDSKWQRSSVPGVTALGHYEAVTLSQLNADGFPYETLHNMSGCPETISISKLPVTNGDQEDIAIPLPHQNGLKLLIPSNGGSLEVEDLQMVQEVNVTRQKESSDENDVLLLSAPASANEESNMGGKVNNSAHFPSVHQHYVAVARPTEAVLIETESEKVKREDGEYELSQEHVGHNKVGIHLAKSPIVDKDSVISSAQDAILLQVKDEMITIAADQVQAVSSQSPQTTLVSSRTGALLLQGARNNISKDPEYVLTEIDTGKDAIITIAADQIQKVSSQSPQTTHVSSRTGALPQTQRGTNEVQEIGTTVGEDHRLDIVKSIIYGGLIESITSVGVVLSAAGADAATLNVIALGLANLFGGLFIIGNDLWDLKNGHTGDDSNRYEITLGRRVNFLLHSVVAIFSYLIFGLLPPVIYGFSFRKSDDRDLKLLVVAGASLLCVAVLAAGKAYVQRPPKSYFKTTMYYVTLGFMVSGAAYVVGNMLNRFLEKSGILPSSSVVTLDLPGTGLTEPAKGSY